MTGNFGESFQVALKKLVDLVDFYGVNVGIGKYTLELPPTQ